MGPDVWGRVGSWGSHLPYFIGPTAGIGLVTPCSQWFIRPALSLATTTRTPPPAHLSPPTHSTLTPFSLVIYRTYGLTCPNNHYGHRLSHLVSGMVAPFCQPLLSVTKICNQTCHIQCKVTARYQTCITLLGHGIGAGRDLPVTILNTTVPIHT